MFPNGFYPRVPRFSREEIEHAISKGDRSKLIYACLSVVYHESDWKYAQDLCVLLSDHPSKTVRGNAILSLSYLARLHGTLEEKVVKPILIRALRDSEDEVRVRAEDAIRDIDEMMNWGISKNRFQPKQ